MTEEKKWDSTDDHSECFTLVFSGNLRDFKANPFKTETPFGVAFAAGLGNALEKLDAALDELEP